MEKFIKGDLVVIPFPFTDLSGSKKRPALVVANIKGDDLWLVQITSQAVSDRYAIPLSGSDLLNGHFNYASNIRPNKIFTLSKDIVSYKIGSVNSEKLSQVESVLVNIICSNQ